MSCFLYHLDREGFFYFSFFLYCKMAWWTGWKCIHKHNRNWLYAQGKHPSSHCNSFLRANIKAKLSVRAVFSHKMGNRFWLCRSLSCSGRGLALVRTCLSELLPYLLCRENSRVGKNRYNFIYQVPQGFSCSVLRGYFLPALCIFT